jgi:phage gp36-like protein
MYCTLDDLLALITETELAQLTTESGDTPDSEVVSEAIARGEAEIDAYLGKRYSLPLAAVPPRVKGLAVDIAIYHLFTRRNIGEGVRRQRYEDALKFLRDVADGRAEIVGLDGAEPAGGAQEVVEVSSATRVFDREKMSGW